MKYVIEQDMFMFFCGPYIDYITAELIIYSVVENI